MKKKEQRESRKYYRGHTEILGWKTTDTACLTDTVKCESRSKGRKGENRKAVWEMAFREEGTTITEALKAGACVECLQPSRTARRPVRLKRSREEAV